MTHEATLNATVARASAEPAVRTEPAPSQARSGASASTGSRADRAATGTGSLIDFLAGASSSGEAHSESPPAGSRVVDYVPVGGYFHLVSRTV